MHASTLDASAYQLPSYVQAPNPYNALQGRFYWCDRICGLSVSPESTTEGVFFQINLPALSRCVVGDLIPPGVESLTGQATVAYQARVSDESFIAEAWRNMQK